MNALTPVKASHHNIFKIYHLNEDFGKVVTEQIMLCFYCSVVMFAILKCFFFFQP